jgi:hypothetical protein
MSENPIEVPAIREWKATALKRDKVIRIYLDAQGYLHVLRDYAYVDVAGEKLPVGTKTHEEKMLWVDVPVEIRQALLIIDGFINSGIDKAEGIK